MVAPDVQIEDGKGTILISSEEGETEGIIRCIYSVPSFRWRLHLFIPHISLSIHCICFSASQLIFGHGGAFPRWHCLGGITIVPDLGTPCCQRVWGTISQ